MLLTSASDYQYSSLRGLSLAKWNMGRIYYQSPVRYCVDDITWVHHENNLRLWNEAKSSNSETGSLDIIMNIFDPPPLVNSGIPEIEPNNHQNL